MLRQEGRPTSNISAFLNARDYLLAHRNDYNQVLRGFSWPRMDKFNWALDYFDVMAADNIEPALIIVEEDGIQRTRTFAELARRSNQMANFLGALGVLRGDHILVMLGNQTALWEVLLAGMKLGAVLIPAAPLLTTEDLRDRLERGNVRHVIAAAEQAAKFNALTGSYTRISADGAVDRWQSLESAANYSDSFTPQGLTSPDDPFLLYFTSGTTAKPKLVRHTHQSYPVGHLSTMYWIGVRPGDLHWNISSPGWAKHAWSSVFAPWNAGEFTLPGSGLPGSYSTVSVNQDNGVIPDLPSFYPDVTISTRSTDWFARFDPVMAAMLARSTGAPNSPQGNAITVNGASFRTDQGIAPGSIASVFGTFGQTPNQILVGDTQATIFYASPTQVNFLVPAIAFTSFPVGVSISVLAAGSELAKGLFTLSSAGPGIFVLDTTDPQRPGAIENQDSSVNGATNAAAAGSVVQIFATGYGPLDANGHAQVQVYFGDLPAQVLYSGPAPGFPGSWQINAQIPQGPASGQVPVYLTAGSLASNGVTLWVP